MNDPFADTREVSLVFVQPELSRRNDGGTHVRRS